MSIDVIALMSYVVLSHQELFSEVGELKRYSMNYDKDGKSKVEC